MSLRIQALLSGKTIATLHWIQDCVHQGRQLDTSCGLLARPLPAEPVDGANKLVRLTIRCEPKREGFSIDFCGNGMLY